MARHHALTVTLTVVVVAVLSLSGCAPVGGGSSSQIQATGQDVELTIEAPPSTEEGEEVAVAVDAAQALPVAGSYLMLRPSEITASGPLSDGGVQLRLTLPETLPDGATGTFSYFDAELGVWVPVPTELAGREATATVSHLSLWTFVVSGTEEILIEVATGFEQAGEVIDDAATWWNTEGDGWLYRQAGLLLEIQAEAPTCEQGMLPPWAESTVVSLLNGIPVDNQSVLRCVGVDPDDESRIQIKAVANRAYGFTVAFAAGVTPENMQWSQLEDLGMADVDALAGFLAGGGMNPTFLDPREFLVGTTQLSFSVSEEDVRAVPDGAHLVLFGKPDELQMALSLVYKTVFDSIEGQTGGLVGVVLALRDCDPAALRDHTDPAAAIGSVLACIKAVDDDGFQKTLDEVTTAASERGDWPPVLQQVFEKNGTKVLRTVLKTLKWIDVATLVLWSIDYLGERTDDAWYVDIIPVSLPSWGDINDVWCAESFPLGCLTITLPTNSFGEEVTFTEEESDCFRGRAAYAEPGSPGSKITFCPAGVPTPADVARLQPVLDNPAFDRVWYYNGFEPPTLFREGEEAAATGG